MFRPLLIGMSVVSVISMPMVARMAEVPLSPKYSSVSSDKSTLKADGIANARITVTAKNTNYATMPNQAVTLQSSRGAMDEIVAEKDLTNSTGNAYFWVSSLKDGSSVYTALVNGVALEDTVTVAYSGGLSVPIPAGTLIKIPDDGDAATLNDTAVYYYASNGRRYVFPNEKVYYTWYRDFAEVRTIPLDQMSLIPIGGNVTYRPGSKLVKFQTDIKTYVPTKGGVLRWVVTEDVASGLFGPNWNREVEDITEAFYVNYKTGTPIENRVDVSIEGIRATVKSIDADLGLTATF